MRYWLFKSEADCYSIDDLAQAPRQTTFWDGVRNYQARNSLRDDVQVGDGVFLYHSGCDPLAIAGTMEVVKAAYADPTQFDRNSRYYDPGAERAAPRWVNVDVKFAGKTRLVGLAELRGHRALKAMQVLKRGNRLSITPVTSAEWETIARLVEKK